MSAMDDSKQSPFASDLCLIHLHLSIVYSIRFLDRINDPLFDRTDDDLTIGKTSLWKKPGRSQLEICMKLDKNLDESG